MKMRTALAVLICGMVPGYAAAQVYWYPIPGRSLPQDQHECLSGSQQYASQSSANVNPYGGVGSASSGYVVNEPLYMSCMMAKGYSFVTKKGVSALKKGMNKTLVRQNWRVGLNAGDSASVSVDFPAGTESVSLMRVGSLQSNECGWTLFLPSWQGIDGSPDYLPPQRIEISVGNASVKNVDFRKMAKNKFTDDYAVMGISVFELECAAIDSAINEALSSKKRASPVITLIGPTMKGRIMIDPNAYTAAWESALRTPYGR